MPNQTLPEDEQVVQQPYLYIDSQCVAVQGCWQFAVYLWLFIILFFGVFLCGLIGW